MTLNGSSSSTTSSAKEIQAKGEADERRYKVILVGISLIILCTGGIGALWFQPTIAKDAWLFLGPVITGGFAYLMGGTQRKSV